MSFGSGYRGSVGGAVQTEYYDQPAAGIPGMIAFASDNNQIDSVYIGEEGGVAAGKGVIFADVVDDNSFQRPKVSAHLPIATTVVTDFKGVVVFAPHMESDINGIPGWGKGRISGILMNHRSGGRIYVRTPIAVDHTIHDVYWQIVPDADFEAGEFGPSDNGANSILIPTAKWITSSTDDDNAIIELFG